MMPRWGAVICSNLAHIETDERVALLSAVSGLKLFNVQHVHGKLTPESIATQVYDIDFEHRAAALRWFLSPKAPRFGDRLLRRGN